MRVAVVGHVEWVTFLPVDRALSPGAILHAAEAWEEPAGGGGVSAVELARLAGESTFFTALGSDAVGARAREALEARGVRVVAAARPEAQRRAYTVVDPEGERTIVVVGPPQAPTGAELEPAAFADLDAVYFCKGDAAALRVARHARVLVASARELPVLQAAGVRLDALVHSGRDAGERYAHGDLDPEPALVVTTEGAAGGRYRTADGREGRWAPAPLTGALVDAYGAGDSFAAALTWSLGFGLPPDEAVRAAAERAATALCRRGAHGVTDP